MSGIGLIKPIPGSLPRQVWQDGRRGMSHRKPYKRCQSAYEAARSAAKLHFLLPNVRRQAARSL